MFGVSAVGKSTVGAGLADRLNVRFLDADDFHTPTSIAKMSNRQPLDDADRLPWLVTCGRALANTPSGAVLACSALARRYRRILVEEAPGSIFVHLATDIDRISVRAAGRTGHFMPPALVQSQFAALEPLRADEDGFVVDADNEPAAIVDEILAALGGAPD